MDIKQDITAYIKAEAQRLGFCACGIAPAHPVEERVQQYLQHWLNNDYCADMDYMRNYYEQRTNPCLLVEGARSVVSVALSYYPQQTLNDEQLQFAYYAYGQDYHEVMKKKLRLLYQSLSEYFCQLGIDEKNILLEGNAELSGRVFCDTAPLMEKYWAWQAGLGWIGKHTQLVTKIAGSYVFLGEMIINVDLVSDAPLKNYCGKCEKCLNDCPTKALREPFTLDARKCLSYLTIENRGDIPQEAAKAMETCVYGCDRCIKACPWNKNAKPTTETDLQPNETFMHMTKEAWLHLDVDTYRKIFKGSAVKRAKFEGLLRNIRCVFSIK